MKPAIASAAALFLSGCTTAYRLQQLPPDQAIAHIHSIPQTYDYLNNALTYDHAKEQQGPPYAVSSFAQTHESHKAICTDAAIAAAAILQHLGYKPVIVALQRTISDIEYAVCDKHVPTDGKNEKQYHTVCAFHLPDGWHRASVNYTENDLKKSYPTLDALAADTKSSVMPYGYTISKVVDATDLGDITYATTDLGTTIAAAPNRAPQFKAYAPKSRF